MSNILSSEMAPLHEYIYEDVPFLYSKLFHNLYLTFIIYYIVLNLLSVSGCWQEFTQRGFSLQWATTTGKMCGIHVQRSAQISVVAGGAQVHRERSFTLAFKEKAPVPFSQAATCRTSAKHVAARAVA